MSHARRGQFIAPTASAELSEARFNPSARGDPFIAPTASAERSGARFNTSAPAGNNPSIKRTSLKRLPVTAISASISTVYTPSATTPASAARPGFHEGERRRCNICMIVILFCLVDVYSILIVGEPGTHYSHYSHYSCGGRASRYAR